MVAESFTTSSHGYDMAANSSLGGDADADLANIPLLRDDVVIE